METNLVEIAVALPQEKKDQILHQCQSLSKRSTILIRELTNPISC